MERNNDGSVTLTREDLYRKVWATPIRQLANEFGLSDVGLAKICKKHDIPRPPVGYWSKRRHGKKVIRARLPKAKKAPSDDIRIRPQVRDDLATLRPEIQEAILAERLTQNAIKVTDELVDPLLIIERTAKSLHAARADDWGRVRPRAKSALYVAVTPGSIDRAMRIMDALLRALEKRSYAVSTDGEREISVEVHGERLAFSLMEEVRREEKELTKAELREHDPWFTKPRPEYHYVPSGRLSLEIYTGGCDGIRRRWSDGKKQRLERVLNSFVISLLRVADAT